MLENVMDPSSHVTIRGLAANITTTTQQMVTLLPPNVDLLDELKVASFTKDSVHLAWKVARNFVHRVQGFVISYQASGSSVIQTVELAPSASAHDIKKLHEDTIYDICVTVQTNLPTQVNKSCLEATTHTDSFLVALGSTLGAFFALGIILGFVLLAKFQHQRKMRKRYAQHRQMYSDVATVRDDTAHLSDLYSTMIDVEYCGVPGACGMVPELSDFSEEPHSCSHSNQGCNGLDPEADEGHASPGNQCMECFNGDGSHQEECTHECCSSRELASSYYSNSNGYNGSRECCGECCDLEPTLELRYTPTSRRPSPSASRLLPQQLSVDSGGYGGPRGSLSRQRSFDSRSSTRSSDRRLLRQQSQDAQSTSLAQNPRPQRRSCLEAQPSLDSASRRSRKHRRCEAEQYQVYTGGAAGMASATISLQRSDDSDYSDCSPRTKRKRNRKERHSRRSNPSCEYFASNDDRSQRRVRRDSRSPAESFRSEHSLLRGSHRSPEGARHHADRKAIAKSDEVAQTSDKKQDPIHLLLVQKTHSQPKATEKVAQDENTQKSQVLPTDSIAQRSSTITTEVNASKYVKPASETTKQDINKQDLLQSGAASAQQNMPQSINSAETQELVRPKTTTHGSKLKANCKVSKIAGGRFDANGDENGPLMKSNQSQSRSNDGQSTQENSKENGSDLADNSNMESVQYSLLLCVNDGGHSNGLRPNNSCPNW